jgi:phosphotriesterase-related protein
MTPDPTPPASGARVMTVLGPVDPAAIGPTMMHEHVFADTRGYHDSGRIELPDEAPNDEEPIDQELVDAPMDARIAGLARYALWGYPQNMVITAADDFELMAEELGYFAAAAANGCIVDLTPLPLAPDPEAVRRLAEQLGIHAISSTGIYIHEFHPAWVETAPVEVLEDFFLKELAEGVAGTTVRPGVIGEIGTSPELQPCEERVLRAAARAGAATGTPVGVHTRLPSPRQAQQMVDIVEHEGLAPERLWFSHLDEIVDHHYHVPILKRGVTIGFDSFGQDGYFTPSWKSRSDNEKSQTLAELIDCGYERQLVMGQDVCRKHYLHRFGGLGYDHVLKRVAPRLHSLFGVSDEALRQVLVANPRRILARPEAA